ncbi:hypothetical protein, partial [Faecalicoccus pleomorphus]|uniref:hypothetical protein n=1 Tax=Faecalicoccus pleomorphus TaxID=1323 RepID=UPI002942CC29
MKIVDFTNAQKSGLTYGGMSGLKRGIQYDDSNWILKFQRSTSGMNRVDNSQMTSSLSEYIGSHVFECLDIPVHETLLGVYKDRVVVACKDFTNEHTVLEEYKSLKNDFNEELSNQLEDILSETEGHGSNLKPILICFESNVIFRENPDFEKRFWIQSIVDILINNNDRNSGNWGTLLNRKTMQRTMAPVYDNGGSFYNKRGKKSFQRFLNNPELLNQVCTTQQTAYKLDGHIVSAQKFINIENENLKDAVLNIVPVISTKFQDIQNMIQEIPESYQGIAIIDQSTKDFYIKSMEIRFQEILLPRFKEICKERHLDPELMMEIKAQDLQFLSEEIYNFLQSVESYNNQKVVGDCYKEWIEDDLSHGGSEIRNFIEGLKEDCNFTSNQEEVMSHILSRL